MAPTETPQVTFIVPCYKLAHLLPECVDSILAQTYANLEILIMDDCSPDDTAGVAGSFRDPRIRYVRNETNLGHLRNYNKGISLAAGDYIWLISADDRLRVPDVVARYVEVMEAHPQVGYVFCPGYGLLGQKETEVVGWATLDGPDAILDGRVFLRRLLQSNCVLAPAGLVRRECYERLGAFPLDLPFAGDWYLWCMFALHYDVAYLAEPMVNYREHSLSMTDTMITEDVRLLSRDDLAVRWRMKRHIEAAGDTSLAEYCTAAITADYVQALSSKRWRTAKFRMTLEEFERSLALHASDDGEREQLRRTVFAAVGSQLYWDKDLDTDLRLYRLALEFGPPNPRLRAKYGILRLGPLGTWIMRLASNLRHTQPERSRQ